MRLHYPAGEACGVAGVQQSLGDGALTRKNLISLITTHADSPRKSDRSICWLMSVRQRKAGRRHRLIFLVRSPIL
ncbi:MAG: hypothetical protein V7K40_24790 [Nostoc sp.]|uniref:hypothetical protein n=1 Tax=Nostoc sp. TaxID=1180 RepID=UPI002FF85E1A